MLVNISYVRFKLNGTSNKYTIVDLDRYKDILIIGSWSYSNGYARTSKLINGKWITVFLHKLLYGNNVDHVNTDKLDNREHNIRYASVSQNAQNKNKSVVRQYSSKYKGVCFDKSRGKFNVNIRLNGKIKLIGRFDNEDLAGLAYNKAAKYYFGEFAKLNIIT